MVLAEGLEPSSPTCKDGALPYKLSEYEKKSEVVPLTQLRGICYGLQLTQAVFHLTSKLVLLTGLEPASPSLQGMCNSQLYESSIIWSIQRESNPQHQFGRL